MRFRISRISIRKKITYSFYFLLLIMVSTVVFAYGIVNQVEHKVIFVEIIDDFLNTTLEFRRFEKNYFLYGQEKDYEENQQYLQKMDTSLLTHKKILTDLVDPKVVEDLTFTIAEYKKNITKLHTLIKTDKSQGQAQKQAHLEELVRTAGKKITDFAEAVSKEERRSIQRLLKTTMQVLIFSMVGVVFLVIVFAGILGQRIVKSMKLLEEYTKKIARGEPIEEYDKNSEEEIRSLIMAFKRMTRYLKRSQQQLVQSEKLAALGTLLAGVAHELNNPLSNISTSAQILDEEIEGENFTFKKNLISQIEVQSDKARDIVKTLLEFSRVKEFSKQNIRLLELLEETLMLIRGQLPTDVNVSVDVPDYMEVFADKQRLQQVFLNLIKNGIDAVGETGNVWVSATETKKDGGREIEIIVEDDGPGINPEALKKIFDPFFSTKDVGKGSGLGLFIVHDIIEWHGGKISVESMPGQGTTFIIWFPKQEEEDI